MTHAGSHATDQVVIRKVLIANRGEIARRIQRTCRDLGVRTVAVFSDVDAASAFVTEADEAYALGGRSAAESYLRGDALIDAAQRAGADAIHPGYGFLAENAEFAAAVVAAGIVFLGPRPETIEAMGSKVCARDLMEAAGVPMAPALTLGPVADDDPDVIVKRLGLPVMIKASAGGGGKGMRIARTAAEVAPALRTARSEALSAFGDDTVFVERYVERARHIEVQIIGDRHGDVRHLFERECSIQRRHQKVIEEAPSPVVSPALRERLTAIAVSAGQALGYVGVGTVEFLYAEASDEIFFLEINTRLQVEHAVTEAITGLDLVKAQLEVAEGAPLATVIGEPQIHGHAIEARLYAEDAGTGFLPATGVLQRCRFPVGPGLRIDVGPADGERVTADYDPMIAKVVAHAGTRAAALRKLTAALREAEIHGLTTNRDFLVQVLEDPDVARGRFDTQFLDTVQFGASLVDVPERRVAAAAAALVLQARQREGVTHGRTLPSGWRNNGAPLQRRVMRAGDDEYEVCYRLEPAAIVVDGVALSSCRIHGVSRDGADLEVDGHRIAVRVAVDRDEVYVNTSAGQVRFRAQSRFPQPDDERAPGSLASPVPGRVMRLDCAVGDAVEQGAVMIVVEAMKMQHELIAPVAGIVSQVRVQEGSQVDAGAVVVVIAEPEV